jgi:hypothetical protein
VAPADAVRQHETHEDATMIEREQITMQRQATAPGLSHTSAPPQSGELAVPYEELLRVLGHLIDTGDWHEVVVVETNGGVLLKGIKIERGQAGIPLEMSAEHWYSRAELLEISIERSARRSGVIRKLARFLAR